MTMETRTIPTQHPAAYTTDAAEMRTFVEMLEIIGILNSELPHSCLAQGRVYTRRDGTTRFAVSVLTPTPRYLVNELLEGSRELITTQDVPDHYRVDEHVMARIRNALKRHVKLEPILGGRRRYRGRSVSGISVTVNTHICSGRGMTAVARQNIGYHLSCEV